METGKQDQNKPQEKNKTAKDQQKMVKFLVYELAFEFGLLIAIPLIALVYLGKWLDARYDTKYWVIIGVFLALTVSVITIAKRIKEIRKRLK